MLFLSLNYFLKVTKLESGIGYTKIHMHLTLRIVFIPLTSSGMIVSLRIYRHGCNTEKVVYTILDPEHLCEDEP